MAVLICVFGMDGLLKRNLESDLVKAGFKLVDTIYDNLDKKEFNLMGQRIVLQYERNKNMTWIIDYLDNYIKMKHKQYDSDDGCLMCSS